MKDLFDKPVFKPKKCKHCREEFVPYKPLQIYCGPDCFYKAGMARLAVNKKKDWRVEKAQRKEKIMTKGDYEKILQDEINLICRLIDKGCNCISCAPNTPIQKIFGGHLHSVGSFVGLRFHLHNIHRQCYSCNGNKGGKPLEYLAGLTREYGKEYADSVHYDLTRNFKYMNWTIDDLKHWTTIARLIVKELKEMANTYTAEERIYWRTEYNFRLGIYV